LSAPDACSIRTGPSRRWQAPLQALPALILGLLAGCDGTGLLGNRLSGTWCLPASGSSGESVVLSLSGDGTGLMTLIPGSRPSIPFDWREDRQRLLLLQPGSQEIAYTAPITADAQGQTQLMLPGLGSLFNLNLHRCVGNAPPATLPPAGLPSPAPGGPPSTAPAQPNTAPEAIDSHGALTLAVILVIALVLLLGGAITVMMVLRGREDD